MSFFGHGTRSHPRQGRKSEKRSKPKDGSSKQAQATPVANHLSFLFVVNEFSIYDDENGFSPCSDRFGNPLPPNTSAGYYDEIKGQVWRYENGVVSPAPGYVWSRPEQGLPGSINIKYQGFDEQGQPTLIEEEMEVHSTYSVFNCWRFLPCIWTNADSSAVEEMNVEHKWNQLEFRHDAQEHGVTHICGSERHVAGKHPSWIPGLLPETYATPHGGAHQSKGLGGPLGIIIGLMALSKKRGHADDVFRDGLWRNNRWGGGRRSGGAGEQAPTLSFLSDDNADRGWASFEEPDSKGPPRGVMVQICCDSYHNPYGSTVDTIIDFEESGKVIID